MQINKISFFLFFFGLLFSCQPKDKFDWEIGLSAPKYYSSIPSVSFYNKGKIVHNVSTDFGIDPGWGETSGGYASGSEPDEIPDSLVVNWDCGVDMVSYELKTKLPREKMLQLFQNPVTDIEGIVRPYSLIIVGTAPGGNVTVWMRAISVLTEIAKFKAKEIKKNNPYDKDRVTLWTSTGESAKENLIYLNLHGIPYSVWQKGEKEYDYDIGFTSEGEDIKNLIITSFTKEGSWYQSFTGKESESTVELFKWDDFKYIENNNLVKKVKLPVQLSISWRNTSDDIVLNGEVLMPQNLEKLMTESYLDSITGKLEYFNRIIIGAYKGGGRGVVWLTGKNKKTKLLEFILDDVENKNIKNHMLYSLPKGFRFPKWEGREKLIPPDVEFWQEK
ncbi:DUF2931 family protein [Flavobacterium sp.]|uniref:DUF2931 family protein n=1 Tax=Flavobacterium sp. TaxID=239 RepID=UPI002CC4CBD1|nr:DUF2931 family protein [Flavobacterium sp.]HSD05676.1 DUF2931 family protein [Flavobacterium sp.]